MKVKNNDLDSIARRLRTIKNPPSHAICGLCFKETDEWEVERLLPEFWGNIICKECWNKKELDKKLERIC